MGNAINSYLSRRAHLLPWQIEGNLPDTLEAAIVIPALAEYPEILDTLNDLAVQPQCYLDKTLVLVIVNNTVATHSSGNDRENNQELLAFFRRHTALKDQLQLAWIDAASNELALPPGEGVGLARKIGMDHALALLKSTANPGILISLDADTRVDSNYLAAIYTHFQNSTQLAAVISYAHPLDTAERHAIIPYEIYMRYQRIMLQLAHSPYAFHALGSAIACTASSYCAVGGMPRRSAGEDFYLLQKLVKMTPLNCIYSTCVSPSSRQSVRVPFGTGPQMASAINKNENQLSLPHPACYFILRDWFDNVRETIGVTSPLPGHEYLSTQPVLKKFLINNNMTQVWEQIYKSSPRDTQRWMQFHRWFDGLKTIRCLHYFRTHGLPEVSFEYALSRLTTQCGEKPPFDLSTVDEHEPGQDCAAQEQLLLWLRELDKQRFSQCGIIL